MPTRKEIVKVWLAKMDSNLSELAELMGISKQKLSYHFQKKDISLDLFEEISKKLKEKGINIDNSFKQSIYSGRDSIVRDSNVVYSGIEIDELRRQLAKAEGKIEVYKEQLEKAQTRIAELERKNNEP